MMGLITAGKALKHFMAGPYFSLPAGVSQRRRKVEGEKHFSEKGRLL